MGEHYKSLSAIFPMIFRIQDGKQQVLLLQRLNTGYMDGKWDFAASGHVDENESASQAVVRECQEEIGILVKQSDLRFAHLCHRVGLNGNRTYYDIYFVVEHFANEPHIAEPEKCSDLRWFSIDELPDDMIEIRRQVLIAYLNGVPYSEVIND